MFETPRLIQLSKIEITEETPEVKRISRTLGNRWPVSRVVGEIRKYLTRPLFRAIYLDCAETNRFLPLTVRRLLDEIFLGYVPNRDDFVEREVAPGRFLRPVDRKLFDPLAIAIEILSKEKGSVSDLRVGAQLAGRLARVYGEDAEDFLGSIYGEFVAIICEFAVNKNMTVACEWLAGGAINKILDACEEHGWPYPTQVTEILENGLLCNEVLPSSMLNSRAVSRPMPLFLPDVFDSPLMLPQFHL